MERSEQELVRFEKLRQLREQGFAFPNNVKIVGNSELVKAAATAPDAKEKSFTLAGRIVSFRLMGKAGFFHLLDGAGKVQVYVKKEEIGEEAFKLFEHFDMGDIVEVTGYPFVTKTGENSLHARSVRILTKSLIPLPEKWHGLKDVELRYRHRYVDLIANPEIREVFRKRAKIISCIRNFFDSRGYVEVETPVLQTVAGGATARPFKTFHNTLHEEMYMRIALELPLKKLIVGGLERVYEIGRIFRNEGVSKKHNPEFTMIEFYQAYATFDDLMMLTEELYVELASKILGKMILPWGEHIIDLTPPWPRLSMVEAIHRIGGIGKDMKLDDLSTLQKIAATHDIALAEREDWGRSLADIFEALVEHKLINPTFITHHPFSISPLARKNDQDPTVTDRFELIIAGMESANAFSELNDAIDQRGRFEEQARRKAAGDHEAADIEEDFLKAIEYGMPPTAGQGIGIDRLVMLFTNSPTIRDVLLFPQLKSTSEEGNVGS